MTIDPSAEIHSLRTTVRDLLALSTIPEAWVGREPPAIVADLADLLIGSLELDFAFVRLCDPTGCQVVEVTRGNSWKAFPEWLQEHLAAFGQISRKEVVANVGGVEKSCCGIVIPIGVNSERGLVAAASDRLDFPDQIDQQLLSVAANNAATAFQNAFLINELRSAQKALRDHEQELRKAHDELEIKVAERTAELRRSEKELRDVIDTIPATVWSMPPDGSDTYVNKHFVEYSGLSTEQTAGSGWQAAIHPDDLERHAGKWMEAVATGKPHENEVRFRGSDGQYRWHLDRGVPLRDEDGNIVKWYGVVTDIEDRKRAEQRLRESEAYLAEAQRLSQTGSWAWNPVTGDIRYWSEMCYRVLGFDPAGRLPRFEEFFHRIHPDDQAAVRERFEKAIRDKADFELDYRIVHPEKEIRDIHVVGHAVLDGSSNLDEFVGTVIDVTERKRAEEALQQSQLYLAEGQPVSHLGSWAFNAAGFEYWSTELYRIYGLDPSGKPPTVEEYLALVHPEDRAFMKQGIAKMLDDHLAFDFTKRIVRPDGELRHVRCVGVPVSQGGIFQGFLGTGMDVTDQEQTMEELRLSEQYLSEAQRLAHMGSWAFNPSGFFEYWSEELFKIYGLDPRKGSPTLEEYLATLHPQDRDFMANTIKRMHAERGRCDVKKRIVRPDGEQRYIRCVGIPVVEGEVLKGFLGTAIDITEQELLTQELERQQAYLAEAQKLSHTGSWAWSPATDNRYYSEECYRVLGFEPHGPPPPLETVIQRIHLDDQAYCREQIERAIREKVDCEFDYRIVHPDKRVRDIHCVGHPVLDRFGDLVELLGTVIDI